MEITVTSKAAGRPLHQLGRNMSAGRDLVPGIRVGTSFRGASAADWAAEKRASRMLSCRWIRSPLPLASVPGLPRSVRVLIMRRRKTFENRGRPGLKRRGERVLIMRRRQTFETSRDTGVFEGLEPRLRCPHIPLDDHLTGRQLQICHMQNRS